MTTWNKLLTVLDQVYGFPNQLSSTVKKLQQGYDNDTEEHVIWLEYRITIGSAPSPKPDPTVSENERLKRERGYGIINAILDDVLREHHSDCRRRS